MPSRAIILHTNDIHGRTEQFARVLTTIDTIRRDNPGTPVIYVDAGDSEDTSNRLSNLTKGTSMHRLLGLAKPAAITVGNASIARYGPQVLPNHAAAAKCALLCANLTLPDGSLLPGVKDGVVIDCGEFSMGIVGLTAPRPAYEKFFDLRNQDPIATTRRVSQRLRADGAHVIMVLSHLGFSLADEPDDQALADHLGSDINLIVGAHTHHLLPSGARRGKVLIAQAGDYGRYLGRIDVFWDGQRLQIDRVRVQAIEESIEMDPQLARTEARLEAEMDEFLDEHIGTLMKPLLWSTTQECGTANLVADALRAYAHADIGLSVAGFGFVGGLGAGPITRRHIWERCPAPGNPGIVMLSGEQITLMMINGLDMERAAERPPSLRGVAKGLMHISGAHMNGDIVIDDATGQPLEPHKVYRVAATDGEFEHIFGYALEEWQLEPHYEVPTIVRDVVERYLREHDLLDIGVGRLNL